MSVEPVQVELGYDRYEAMAICNEAKARGLKVELLLMDSNGLHPGLSALAPHRLLVLPDEVDAVNELTDGGAWRDYVEWEGRIEDLPRSAPVLFQVGVLAVLVMLALLLVAALF